MEKGSDLLCDTSSSWHTLLEVGANMASARKKLDEKHLKILRELASIPANKHCFDCHQRGPTYVNVTIGSFVCTTCSGMLRGLTPPHRVKSISMATFTPEEVELLRSRGNQYCKHVWLGLCETEPTSKDEQHIKDFMIDKYEKKRYFVDPANIEKTMLNGGGGSSQSSPSSSLSSSKSLPSLGFTRTPPTSSSSLKLASPLVNNNNNINNSNISSEKLVDPFSGNCTSTQAASQPSFANFDNNPIFNASSTATSAVTNESSKSMKEISGLDFDPWSNIPLGPIEHFQQKIQSSTRTSVQWQCCSKIPPPFRWSGGGVPTSNSTPAIPAPPTEDRYAALKDLDSLMKSQMTEQQPTLSQSPPEWEFSANSGSGGNGSIWPSSNLFASSSVPVPGAAPAVPSEPVSSSNPFSFGDNGWNSSTNNFVGNPFKQRPQSEIPWSTSPLTNGFPSSQSMNFPPSKFRWNADSSVSNPFAVASNGQTAGHHSSNPFL